MGKCSSSYWTKSAQICNAIISPTHSAGVLAAGSLFVTCFGIGWGVLQTCGVDGSIAVFSSLVGIATALTFILIVLSRLFRWQLIVFAIRADIAWLSNLQKKRDQVIIGVGPGGAIIAGIISKEIGASTGHEPTLIVFDRVFQRNGPAIGVSLGTVKPADLSIDLSNIEILLATSEIHSGNTMKVVFEELKAAGASEDSIRTFSFVFDDKSTFKCDRYVVCSSTRDVLPWLDDPKRRGK